MTKLSRRDFIKLSAMGVGSLTLGQFLAACGQVLSPVPSPTSTPNTPGSAVIPATDTPFSPVFPTELPASATASAPGSTLVPATETAAPLSLPDLVVARGGGPEGLVRQALAALGGIERFVHPGANVIIKPNICTAQEPKYAATTNPVVVGTLVTMCFEASAASVKVMDFPFGSDPKSAYSTSGIRDAVEAAGGEMEYMSSFKYKVTPIPDGIDLKEIAVFEDILNTDVLINVPIAKDHSSTRLTLGMKNLMGAILNRNTIHFNLGQRIADLNTLIKPQLTVVDAVRILLKNGPTGGDVSYTKLINTVIASPDIVAADSYATTLFGLQPGDIAYISAGAAMGLGRMDLQNLNIKEITAGG